MPRDRPLTKSSRLWVRSKQLQHVADDAFAPAAGNLVGDGEEVQKLPHLHAVVHAEVIGHVADAFAHADRIAA